MRHALLCVLILIGFCSCKKEKKDIDVPVNESGISYFGLKGKYRGTCFKVTSEHNFQTGEVSTERDTFEDEISIESISFHKLDIPALFWLPFYGTNKEGQDILMYSNSVPHTHFYNIKIIVSEKKLIFNENYSYNNGGTTPGYYNMDCIYIKI